MNNRILKKISVILIISLFLSSCANQNMIDAILPNYEHRMYTVADLIPYQYKEIKNAQAYYGKELTKFFYDNIATEAELKRDTKEKQDEFSTELRYRTHNYKILKERYAMYVENQATLKETQETARQHEYDEYYKINISKSVGIIKEFNNGKISGEPLMSIRAIMSTATESILSDIISEVDCEIYKPVALTNLEYSRLKFGDEITLTVPATNSTVGCSETRKLKCTYISTDSLLYKDDNGENAYYFIAKEIGTEGYRRILTYHGRCLETYVETAPLQFIKFARVCNANEPTRLMDRVVQGDLEYYNFDEIVERALCGGYLVYNYKDYVYANSITTNLKGYITSLTEYTNLRIDNEYYNEVLNKN